MAVATVTVDLTVRDLLHEDLAGCAWTGSPTHLRFIAAALGRRSAGVVDYLAVCGPSDLPLGVGGIDYGRSSGAGWLWQLAVHPAFRSCGIGTLLVRSAEERILRRGLDIAELGVEPANTRAQRLYARLGYRVVPEDGRRSHCVVMRRHLC
ncbi:GNAT family N-acetyltransferase [Cryptosporangium sp. NPDC048952]|uniref:GNAT family N-acetyltransferase n=1 Tax=Cryptosporangium sp. NPDC048952 TaxID=3363961 RepID=UPI00371DF0EB